MSYGIRIDRSPSTPNDPDLLAITINGVRQVVNFARRDYPTTASLPPLLVTNGHHVSDGEKDVEWVTTFVYEVGPSTESGQVLYSLVTQANDRQVTIDRRRVEPGPGDTARDATPDEIANTDGPE